MDECPKCQTEMMIEVCPLTEEQRNICYPCTNDSLRSQLAYSEAAKESYKLSALQFKSVVDRLESEIHNIWVSVSNEYARSNDKEFNRFLQSKLQARLDAAQAKGEEK